MPLPVVPAILLAAASVAAPLGPPQQQRLAALLIWAEAYQSCYRPAPFSLAIDQRFTARCIQNNLRGDGDLGPPDEQAAIQALIAETPHLVAVLNRPKMPGESPPPEIGRNEPTEPQRRAGE